MNKNSRLLMVALLMLSSIVAVTQAGFLSPSYAQLSVASKSHTTGGPPFQVGTTTTTANSGSASSESKPGRRGGVPPGLVNAWAHSNMSVVARAVTHAIFLNGTHGVELAEIAINASSNGQLIENVALNESVVEIQFDHDGAVELTANSSARPTAVFADNTELSEADSAAGLTPNSNAWFYDQNSHMLIVDADPSAITIMYGLNPTPVPEYPTALLTTLALVAGLSMALLLVKRRAKRS